MNAPPRGLAHSPDELRELHTLCREGRLYEIERWIGEERPLQLAPESLRKGSRPKSALEIAITSGQHSLAFLLLRSSYRLDLERCSPLDWAMEARRWDLVDLLLEWGADIQSADVCTLLDTYNVELYERFRAAGYDLTQGHELGDTLGHTTSNRPLLGFAKRHRLEDPKIQQELNIALWRQVRAGNERGVNLCLWAGADPRAPVRDPQFETDEGESEDEERFLGWSAIEEAASTGPLEILRRLGPDPARDDFDSLYQHAQHEFTVQFLLAITPPKDVTQIISWHVNRLGYRLPGVVSIGTGTIEALFRSGVQWSEHDAGRLAEIRRSLLRADESDFKRVIACLRQRKMCSPETYRELTRTPKIQGRLTKIGFGEKLKRQREKAK